MSNPIGAGDLTADALRFARMHGCGNDFVVIDDRDGKWFSRRAELARALCDRRKGLGGDGLILIGNGKDTDFTMTYVNGTGVDGEMCGNGARCVVRRAHDLQITGDRTVFSTEAGPISARIEGGIISLGMTRPRDAELHITVESDGRNWTVHYIDTGVPHIVIFIDQIDDGPIDEVDVARYGPGLRRHPRFPRGANVNFAEKRGANTYRVRTYERGVEAETLACGTGSVATALIAHLLGEAQSPVTILPTGGGTLRIDFRSNGEGRFEDVQLAGPAETIATGTIAEDWLRERKLLS
ncbi:diaminopimelate epimerase [Dongia soli]|uniref:Diaminopimelate epimerase n=1 Tax=Dongia soli TaxID=600628 RepID=A0ABU5EIC2_9PROT|nr:diaminopimelate epimerase [Dongia soli]MDY0885754.1 diaminopimelate epimerase [Dongia soli]